MFTVRSCIILATLNHTSDTLEAKKIPFHNIMHTHKHIFTLKHAEKFIVAGITREMSNCPMFCIKAI